jgi:ABC-type nitrate/sulfonate/bicarbonate transport system ATPase subunit
MVMITNDIDEAILLADTIYTLTSSPGATLGPAISIDVGHPRSRGQMSGQPVCQAARREMLRLLATGGKTNTRAARALGAGIYTERAGVH